ncbi:hypothetical protein AncyloWKF20_11115 [Ancylobacter sp. WKF20]|uniref:hypothetical protein n=1 Tax=Ancylobacter sp. WKF20 TaxID=3039801 RepID=UPI0024346103|nr:hypothetical protein [Ancylobacter sp. WKF20]WGD28369.1 hypothetical protein AncyloWKF20_11115 [Ancylobacter sp. WKF20]
MRRAIEGDGRFSSVGRVSIYINVLRFFLALSLSFSLFVLFVGLKNPIMDMYSFRQTQTALTSYWLLHGGPWIAYETPVLGAPWAMPFEFPVYQLIVSALAMLGVPLDVAGRLVNFGFFLGTLGPLWLLFRALRLGPASYLATAILYVLSPLYLYWSRTFLIESCALFFSMLWLALLAHYLTRGGWVFVAGAVVAGCLAVLAKSTTFPAFVLVGGLGAAWTLIARLRGGERLIRLLAEALILSLTVIVPFTIAWVWVSYSDQVKLANEFGSHLTSTALSSWNFGTLDQKLSAHLWKDIILARILPDIAGSFYLMAVAVIVFGLVLRKSAVFALIAIVGFFSSIMLFTNVHMVHNYYQVANGLFLIMATGIALGAMFDRGLRAISLLCLMVIGVGQYLFFQKIYSEVIKNDHVQDRTLQIALIAKAQTQPSQSLLVIGEDWSSAVAYYSERKSLTLPAWATRANIERVFADPQAFLGDRPLGGIVFCANRAADYGAAAPLVQSFVADRAVMGEFGGCQLLAAQRSS